MDNSDILPYRAPRKSKIHNQYYYQRLFAILFIASLSTILGYFFYTFPNLDPYKMICIPVTIFTWGFLICLRHYYLTDEEFFKTMSGRVWSRRPDEVRLMMRHGQICSVGPSSAGGFDSLMFKHSGAGGSPTDPNDGGALYWHNESEKWHRSSTAQYESMSSSSSYMQTDHFSSISSSHNFTNSPSSYSSYDPFR